MGFICRCRKNIKAYDPRREGTDSVSAVPSGRGQCSKTASTFKWTFDNSIGEASFDFQTRCILLHRRKSSIILALQSNRHRGHIMFNSKKPLCGRVLNLEEKGYIMKAWPLHRRLLLLFPFRNPQCGSWSSEEQEKRLSFEGKFFKLLYLSFWNDYFWNYYNQQ